MSEVTFSGNTIGDKAIYLTGVARGEKNERERIIKLLEQEKLEMLNSLGDVNLIKNDVENLEYLIALIKGEPNGETN